MKKYLFSVIWMIAIVVAEVVCKAGTFRSHPQSFAEACGLVLDIFGEAALVALPLIIVHYEDNNEYNINKYINKNKKYFKFF